MQRGLACRHAKRAPNENASIQSGVVDPDPSESVRQTFDRDGNGLAAHVMVASLAA